MLLLLLLSLLLLKKNISEKNVKYKKYKENVTLHSNLSTQIQSAL